MSDFLTAAEAALFLRLDVRRVQTLARLGRLPAVRTGRKWLFDRSAILGMLGTPSRASAPSHASNAFRNPKELSELSGRAADSRSGVDISARNQLIGVVKQLNVDGLMAEVRIGIGDQELVSVITRTSAERLGLAEGAEVLAVIKSTEIMVARRAR